MTTRSWTGQRPQGAIIILRSSGSDSPPQRGANARSSRSVPGPNPASTNPTPPWEFRRGDTAAASSPVGPIVGNRNSRIYHTPGCTGYNSVSEKNRVYFKSTSEAQAAGYRAAKNCNK